MKFFGNLKELFSVTFNDDVQLLSSTLYAGKIPTCVSLMKQAYKTLVPIRY